MSSAIPSTAAAAVLQPSAAIPDTAIPVQGPDFERLHSLQDFLASYECIGFQANSLGRAISIVNKMVCDELYTRIYITPLKKKLEIMASLRRARC